MSIGTINEALEHLRLGRPIIVVDDEARENEGDLIIPAQFATPAQVNFMARFGRGLICLAMPKERARALAKLNQLAAIDLGQLAPLGRLPHLPGDLSRRYLTLHQGLSVPLDILN